MADNATTPNTAAGNKQRFTETAKFLPVLFVWGNIIGLYLIFMFFHCLPMLRHPDYHSEGMWQLAFFNVVTALLVTCYLLCILVHPGTIPEKDEDPTWEYVAQDQCPTAAPCNVQLQEAKRSGDRRHCKWCAKFKPDRCHHCRVCRQCILKMDHHCPWIYNCVGFRNHKFFFLLLFYTTIACHYIIWNMIDSVRAATDPRTPFTAMFLLLFGETLACFLGLLVSIFFTFHIWLLMKAMTTIEFCEKSMKKSGYDSSAYDRGFLKNLKAVLGDNPFLWLLPCSPPSGSGLSFVEEDAPIVKSLGFRYRKEASDIAGFRVIDDEPDVEVNAPRFRGQTAGDTSHAPGSLQGSDEEESPGEATSGSDREREARQQGSHFPLPPAESKLQARHSAP